MRVVDINRIGDADGLASDEIWRVDPLACQGEPASFDSNLSDVGRSHAIRACLVAMPGPIGELERRVAAHRAAAAPAVLRLCPGPERHEFPLEPWAVSPIPEYCEREEIAIAIDFATTATGYPWAEVVRFARAYLRLSVIALGPPLNGSTPGRALDAAPNIILETSGGDAEGTEIARLVGSHGAYRFAYGSGAARRAPLAVARGLAEADAKVVLAATADQLATGKWAAMHL